jgi:hypothetical protein
VWAFLTCGFYSIIQHRDDPELLLVRARVKGDLEKLKEKYLPNLGKIVYMPTADYPYRALAWRVEVADAAKLAILDINYTNFKSEVSKQQGSARHDLYMRVWGVMKHAEEDMKKSSTWNARWEKDSKGSWHSKDQLGFFSHEDDGTIDFAKSRKAREERIRDIHKKNKGEKHKKDEGIEEETLDEALAYSYSTDVLDQYWCPNCRLFGGHYKNCKYSPGGKK